VTADVEHDGNRVARGVWGSWKRPPNRRANITSEARIGKAEGHKVHLTIDFDGDGKPCVIKLEVHKEGAVFRGMCDALAASMSQSLQHGATLAEVADRLIGIRFEPDGAVFGHDAITACTSIVDLVGQMLAAEVGQ
jgi:hypothetical protein